MRPEQPEVLVERLVAAWSGPRSDEETRWAPARSLVELGEAAVGPVLRACEAARPEVLDALIAVLAGIGQPAVPLLIDALGTGSPPGREAAVEALGLIRAEAAVPGLVAVVLTAQESLRDTAAAALARIGAPAVEAMVAALGSTDDDRRWLLASGLVQVGAPAVPPLVRELNDRRSPVRTVAAGALGRIGGERAVEALLDLLEGGSQESWELAARALASGGPGVVRPLVAALETGDERRRAAAVAALVRVGRAHLRELLDAPLVLTPERGPLVGLVLRRIGEPALEALLERLGSEDSFLRKTAAEGLGWLGDAGAAAPLVRALGDGNGRVRQAAAVALVRVVGPEAVAELGVVVVQPLAAALPRLSRFSDDSCWRALDALRGVTDPSAVKPLVRALWASDPELRRAAGDALVRIGAPAITPLVECARSPVDRQSLTAREVLVALGAPAVVPVFESLVAAREEEIPRLRAVLHALRSDALPLLIGSLADPAAGVRLAAARGLLDLPCEEAVDPLLARLRDGDERVREAATDALASFGHRVVARFAGGQQHDGDEQRAVLARAFVRTGQLDAAVGLGVAAVVPLIEAARLAEGQQRRLLIASLRLIEDPEAVPALVAGLEEAEDVCQAVLDALGRIGAPADGALRQALESPSEATRGWAAAALVRIREVDAPLPEGFVPTLLPLTQAASAQVRRAALQLMPPRPDPGVIEAHLAALRDSEGEVRGAASRALAAIGEPAVPALIEALQDGDPTVRLLAARALGEIGIRVLPMLLAAVRAVEEGRRWDVLYAVTRIRDLKAAWALTGLLDDPDWHLRSTAALALGFLEGRRGVEALALTLKDPDEKVRLSTVTALGRIGGRRAERALARLRRDRSERVREAAAVALDQLRRPAGTPLDEETAARVR